MIHHPGKQYVFGDLQLLRQGFQVRESISAAHENAKTIRSPQTPDQVTQCTQQVVHAILEPHHADIANNSFSLRVQRAVRFDGAEILQFNAVAHDGNACFRHMISLHLYFLVRLICSNDAIGETAREFFQPDERVVDEQTSTAREARLIHFRGQVVMVKDKSLAKQFVKGGDKYKSVRWIVRMDNIKSLAEESQQGEQEGGAHGVPVLPKIPEETIACRRLPVAIKAHTV